MSKSSKAYCSVEVRLGLRLGEEARWIPHILYIYLRSIWAVLVRSQD